MTPKMTTVTCMVNGKIRGQIEIVRDASQEQVIASAMAMPSVAKSTEGTKTRFVVFVPNRMMNMVVG